MVGILSITALLWIGCGVLAYGLTFAHFQGKYPTIAIETLPDDRRVATFMAIAGPIGLFVALIQGEPRKYGLRFK